MNRSDHENGRVVDTFDHSRALCAGTDNMNTTDDRMRNMSWCRQRWKQNCLVGCLNRLNIYGKNWTRQIGAAGFFFLSCVSYDSMAH